MRKFISALAFLLIACSATAAKADDHSATVFPPSGCSADEERIITWMDGSTTTYCRTGQEILNMAIPDCKEGEHVVFHETAPDAGRQPVGNAGGVPDVLRGKFVCEATCNWKPDFKYSSVRCTGTNHCTNTCPSGYIAIGGDCSPRDSVPLISAGVAPGTKWFYRCDFERAPDYITATVICVNEPNCP